MKRCWIESSSMTSRAGKNKTQLVVLAHCFAAWMMLAGVAIGCAPATSPAPPPSCPPTKPTSSHSFAHLPIAASLQPTAAHASRLGAGQLQIVAANVALESDRIGAFWQYKPDQCLLVHAVASQTVQDLDVFIFAEDGTVLASDQSIGTTSAVVMCLPQPQQLYLAARVEGGSGWVALGAQNVPLDRAQELAYRLDAKFSPSSNVTFGIFDDTALTFSPVLRDVQQRRAQLGARWVDIKRTMIPLSPQVDSYVSVDVPAWSCLDVMVFPNESVYSVDASIFDENGVMLVRAEEQGNNRVALVCSPIDTTLTVQMRAQNGFGSAAVVLGRTQRGSEGDILSRADARVLAPMEALESTAETLKARLQSKSDAYGPPTKLASGVAHNYASLGHPFKLPPGCTRFDVVASPPMAGTLVTLWSGDQLQAKNQGGAVNTVFGCASQPLELLVQVEALGASGKYLVISHQELERNALLENNPIAAARLLGWFNQTQHVVNIAKLGRLQQHLISHDQRARFSTKVSVKSCVQIVAALGRGTSGVKLQYENTGAFSRGGQVATISLCAQQRPITAEMTVSVEAGSGTVLVATAPKKP